MHRKRCCAFCFKRSAAGSPMWPLLAVASICVGMSAMLFGQAYTGSISGLVSDQTGAAVVDVAITVTDVDRNVDFRALTNERGFYLVAPLPPGNYRVAAEKVGFRRYVLGSLPLATQQKASINITLELGTVSESVQVTGQAQLVEPGTSTLSTVVENKRIMDLPLNGRNVYALVLLAPGVFTESPAGEAGGIASEFFKVSRFSVAGGMETTSSILMDGVPVDVPFEARGYNAGGIVPALDGIQEFRVQTNAYSAEYGRSGGGIITLATKSGTNELHGSLYEFHRNSVFDSNSFFANRTGQKPGSFKRNQFGGSLGGPLWLPKVYSGKNRTFFFATYEGQRVRSGAFFRNTMPTELEKAGDFSQTLNPAGQMRVVYNPFSTRSDPARPGSFIRDAFPGNRLPLSLVDPVAQKMQEYYPTPNSPGLPFTGQLNFVKQVPQTEGYYNMVTVKMDHYLTDRQRFFVRYSLRNAPSDTADAWGGRNPACSTYCVTKYDRGDNVAADYTNTLSSNTLLNLRYGFARNFLGYMPYGVGFEVASLGLPAFLDQASSPRRFPVVDIQDYATLGGSNAFKYGGTTHSAMGNVTKVAGAHTLKFGAEVRAQFWDRPVGKPGIKFNFNRAMTQGPDPRVPTDRGGVGYASFLLGTGGGGQFGDAPLFHTANRYFGFYAQDDYRVNRRLTVNLGLRWELETGMTERDNLFAVFDPYVESPAAKTLGMKLYGGYLFAGDSLGRRGLVDLYPRAVNPRFGFAYQLSSRLVIRSGYGIFFAPPRWAAGGQLDQSAFSSTTPWVASVDGVTPYELLRNSFPDGLLQPEGTSNGLMTLFGMGGGGTIPQYLVPSPYNQQWNFTIQWAPAKDTLAEIAYVGNKGTHVPLPWPDNLQLNQLRPELLSVGNELLEMVPNPFYGMVKAGGLAQPEVQRGQLLRPYPQWSGVGVMDASVGNSDYHSLQARFEKRFSSGKSLMLTYTWSKWITDGADGYWLRQYSVRNWYCRSCERALSSTDQPQRLVANFTYELPFGRGKALGTGWNRWLNGILGQWQMNGILILSSGLPLAFGTAQNTSYSFGGGQHPDFTGVSPDLGNRRTIDRWFDTSQFLQPAPFTSGNLGRTTNLRQDGYENLAFSVFKMFRIKERAQVQFRGEAFNLMNHPLFAPPNTTLGSPNFGMVLGQQGGPRQFQFALKVLW